MDENIHNEDNFFKKVYNSFEEEPSPEAWEKLNAKLDKKDAVLYRNRSRVWKRSALTLLLLLLLFVGYEYGYKTNVNGELAKNGVKPDSADNSSEQNKLQRERDDVQSSSQTKRENDETRSNKKTEKDSPVAVIPSSKTKQGKANEITENNTADSSDSLYSANQKKGNRVTGNSTTQVESGDKNNTALSQNDSGKKGQNFPNKNTDKIAELNISDSQEANTTETEKKSGNNNIITKTEKHPKLNQASFDSATTAASIQKDSSINIADNKITSLDKKLDSTSASLSANNKKSTIRLNRMFKPHWSFSPYVAADFSGELLDDDDDHRDPNGRYDRHELLEREREETGYSFGVLSRYQFSKKWLAKTGLVISNQFTHIDPQTLYATGSQNTKFKYVTSSGYAYIDPQFSQSVDDDDSIKSDVASEHLSYLTIPLQVSYLFRAGKNLSVLPGIGISTNVLLNSKISTEVHGDEDDEKTAISVKHLQGLDPINFSFIADAELQYRIGNKWNLMLAPSFRYAIDPITRKHVVKTYPYNFGLGFGVTYGL